jgi:hypothetical protein
MYRYKNSQDTLKNAILAALPIAPRGFEPIDENSQALLNKRVMKSNTIVLSDCLDAKNQADLKKIIDAWPKLPEHIQKAILALVGVG